VVGYCGHLMFVWTSCGTFGFCSCRSERGGVKAEIKQRAELVIKRLNVSRAPILNIINRR
jgi:hypothetical protein